MIYNCIFITPLINMLIGHKFVLSYQRTTLQMNGLFCGLLQRGVINMALKCKRFWQIGLQNPNWLHWSFLQNEVLPRTTGFCKLLHPFSLSSFTCVQNKVPAVSKLCVSCRGTNLLAERWLQTQHSLSSHLCQGLPKLVGNQIRAEEQAPSTPLDSFWIFEQWHIIWPGVLKIA